MQPTNKTTVSQLQAATEMSITNPVPASNQQNPAKRIRGGGAAKDCILAAVECFICFECCKGCCECFADIICCPCEMCCSDGEN